MSIDVKRVLYRMLLFGLAGLLFEVFFGALWNLKLGNWNMHGKSSPWMLFDYSLLGLLLMPMARPMIRRGVPLVLRAVVYMIGIFIVEFISGWIFDLMGLKIWDNSSRPYNLCGYIALMYVPIWYGVGLVAEPLHRKLDAMAMVLVRGLSADQIGAEE